MESGTILTMITEDRTSGAYELAAKAVEAVLMFVKECQSLSPEAVRERFSSFSLKLLHAQPSMAPLINLVNGLWLQAEKGKLPEALEEEARRFRAQMAEARDRIAQEAAVLFKKANTVLTYSYSSTVLNALMSARREGLSFTVVCSEGRPAREGLRLTETLASSGIPVKLTLDATLPGLLKEVDLAVVGADALLESGVINKVGTYPLALAAKAASVPFYVLCDSQKFLPPTLERFFSIPDRSPDEVWEAPPPGVLVVNRYFEATPLRLLSGVLSEAGLLSASGARRVLRSKKVAKRLLEFTLGREGNALRIKSKSARP